jgi:hypothetical protein
MSAVMRSGSAAVGLAKARAGTAAANRKFTLAGVTAGIKLVEEDADIALFDHDGGRLRLTHAGQASPSAWRETKATEWQFGWGIIPQVGLVQPRNGARAKVCGGHRHGIALLTRPEPRLLDSYAPFLNLAASSDPPVAFPAL